MRNMFDASREALVVLDSKGVIVQWNAAFVKVFNIDVTLPLGAADESEVKRRRRRRRRRKRSSSRRRRRRRKKERGVKEKGEIQNGMPLWRKYLTLRKKMRKRVD